MKALVGTGVDRLDARAKVTGTAQYAAEIPVANVVHAVIVTSTIGSGRIDGIETHAAEQSPGVLGVLSHPNAQRLPGVDAKQPDSPTDRVLQVLQSSEILYNDQPIAVVVADTLERAQAAASLVRARYTVGDVSAQLRPGQEEYTPKTAGPFAPPDSLRGDLAAGSKAAEVRLEATYTTPVQTHNPMEMHAVTVVWQGRDRLTVYDTSQGIFGVRKRLATLFGLAPENVRVVSHFVGGGFGCKGTPWSHIFLAVMAARQVGRAVRLSLTRQQMFSLVGHRPETRQQLALGATRSGQLTLVKHQVVSETSRFDEFSEPCALLTRMLYACPNLQTSHRLVRLDLPTPTFMRAPGESSGSFALECALDELAYELKMDPLELRAKNYAERDEDEQKPWSSKSLRECYRRAASAFGWERRRPTPGAQREGRHAVGWGMATASYPARQSKASALAKLRPDGSVLVQAGSQDIGTGTYTIMTQLAADALGLPLTRVHFELGDTELPETPVSGGSQTASSTGSAVKRAAEALRERLIEAARADAGSPLHGLSAQAIELRDGALVARAQPARRDPLSELARRSPEELMARIDNPEKPERKQYSSHSFGAQFAEVTVDTETREIRVRRVVSAFAAGKILNPKTARSQFLGGIVWGIGFALLEHTVRDPRSARANTRDLADYHVPVHADIPDIEVLLIDEQDPHVNEIGAKGIGEIGITGISAAIANAVFHATGRRVRDLPITLDKLL